VNVFPNVRPHIRFHHFKTSLNRARNSALLIVGKPQLKSLIALLSITMAMQLAALPSAAGKTADEEAPSVHINAIKNPELKPYRVMLAGLDAFDEYHSLAPNAHVLRFKLNARSQANTDAMDNLSVRIAGEQTSIALPLDADERFILPRNAAADDDNADLVLNKKKGNYRWAPEIRNEEVPDGMRRLGDLRLECEVLIAVARKELPFWQRALVSSILLTDHWCSATIMNMPIRSPRSITSATLLDGQERVALQLVDDRHAYIAPISYKQYSDDALVEIEFAPEK
jgi:hypothetical protein